MRLPSKSLALFLPNLSSSLVTTSLYFRVRLFHPTADLFSLVAIGRVPIVFVRQSPRCLKRVRQLMQGRAVKSYYGPTLPTQTALLLSLVMCVPSVVALKPPVIFSNFQVSFKRAPVVRGLSIRRMLPLPRRVPRERSRATSLLLVPLTSRRRIFRLRLMLVRPLTSSPLARLRNPRLWRLRQRVVPLVDSRSIPAPVQVLLRLLSLASQILEPAQSTSAPTPLV